jgi:hypothetical protein
VDDLRALE